MMALSPMMQQYMEIKENYKDCILFFRLGDFYEMFFDDAKTASAELELTLTGKNCGLEERAPMCGVPFHSADTYVARLVEKGYKVAICEQTEDPQTAKGILSENGFDITEEIEEAATIQPVPVDERQLRQELLDIGYALSQRILGENKDLNTNPISDKHISSIKCLVDIYKTVKGASALENFIKD